MKSTHKKAGVVCIAEKIREREIAGEARLWLFRRMMRRKSEEPMKKV